ncbi:hypothetical protein ONZ45_g3410 [Pleurotus djamor]|nr:hypothetical protein ONZ45_g3410 [Pleurotus djamor]
MAPDYESPTSVGTLTQKDTALDGDQDTPEPSLAPPSPHATTVPLALDATTTVPAKQSAGPNHSRTLLKEEPDSYYLGSASTSESVEWVYSDGFKRQLVTKAPENPNASVYPMVRERAVLSIVARVCEDNLWVAPDGCWRGQQVYPSGATPRLCDTKMSFIAEPVVCDDYEQDWAACVSNVKDIISEAAKENTSREGFLLPKGDDGVARLKMRHALFKELRSNGADGESEGENDKQNTLPVWHFDNWPVSGSAVKDKWEALKHANTHKIDPLPLFDEHGNPVPPLEYYGRLRGATVAIKFTLVHHFFRYKMADVFTANVRNIAIIRPGKPFFTIQSPPSKRKADSSWSDSESPRKKRATD